MAVAVRFRTGRILAALLLLLLGFVSVPYLVILSATPNSAQDESERLFSFEQLLESPAALAPNDSKLIEYIQKRVLFYPKDYESSIIDTLLHGQRNGFFIEAGAWDGEYLSNTLFFERQRNWTGLLVEPNINAYKKLLSGAKRKNSTAANVCLAVHNYPEKMPFDAADVFGGVFGHDHVPSQEMLSLRNSVSKDNRKRYYVQCLPLWSLLLALGNPVVDYFSLDVEGAEMAVLRSIPFDKVDIRTLSIEVAHSNKFMIRKFMKARGYNLVKKLEADYIFVKQNAV